MKDFGQQKCFRHYRPQLDLKLAYFGNTKLRISKTVTHISLNYYTLS